MSKLFNQFEDWLLKTRSQFNSWFSTDKKEKTPPENSLLDLPQEITQYLLKATKDLPTHPAQRETVQAKLNSSLEQWYDNMTGAANSLVILSRSVEPVSLILNESLEGWEEANQTPIRLLQLVRRPTDPTTIRSRLLAQLGRAPLAAKEEYQEIVIIPDLRWCFLRCVEGLDGVEYLRDIVLQDRSRFWLMGCSRVCWQYLSYVSKIDAYFDQTLLLPDLSGEQLQEWIAPIVEKLGIEFATQQEEQLLNNHDEDEDQEEDQQTLEKKYFEQLADVSQGISSVAIQIFMRSLGYDADKAHTDGQPGIVKAEKPDLPKLPDLSVDDHYLLFSLLLHGDMTLPHLAASLGDDESIVQHLVQVLCRTGVVERQEDLLNVNPIYYPRLKDELDNNNFLISKDD